MLWGKVGAIGIFPSTGSLLKHLWQLDVGEAKAGAKYSILIAHRGSTWVIIHCFCRCIKRKLDWSWNDWSANQHSSMGYRSASHPAQLSFHAFACRWSIFPVLFVQKSLSFPLNDLSTMVEHHLVLHARVYLWVLYSSAWVYISVLVLPLHCFNEYSFEESIESRKCETFNFNDFQHCFEFLRFQCPYKFRIDFPISVKKRGGIFEEFTSVNSSYCGDDKS